MPTQILMLDQRAIVYHLVPTQILMLGQWAIVCHLVPTQTLYLDQWTLNSYTPTKADHTHTDTPLKIEKFI
jgi:hypothetical protein